jgi:protein gp37
MSDKSAIEWTDATWNPIVGCSIVSPGCTNCYAMKMAARIQKMNRTGGSGSDYINHYDGTTQESKAGAVWTGKVALAPDKLFQRPLSWQRGRRIFVNSMGDLFHESIPDEWVDQAFAMMAMAEWHTFQVLTKRAERMRDYLSRAQRAGLNGGKPLANVWVGVSCERQKEADERIRLLEQTPAAVRFVSLEPLLGPIDLSRCGSHYTGSGPLHLWKTGLPGNGGWRKQFSEPPPEIDWVIVGGESGSNARPMNPEWARSLRDQSKAAGVAFFFKQWGEFLPVGEHLPGFGKIHGATAVKPGRMKLHYAGTPKQAPKHAFAEKGVAFTATADGRLTFRVGKKRAGRLLDGVEHNGFPASTP